MTQSTGRTRKALKWLLIHALEALALVLALVAVVASALMWLLSQGPLSLEFARPSLEPALAQAMQGDFVAVDRVEAEWDNTRRALTIVLTDVGVADDTGALLARAPRLEADLHVASLVVGRVAFSRLSAEGGRVSVVRRADGRMVAGLGDPDQVVLRAGTGQVRPADDPIAFAARWRQLVSRASEPLSRAGALRAVEVRDAEVIFADEASGWRRAVRLETASLSRTPGGLEGLARGDLVQAGGEGRIMARLSTGAALEQAFIQFTLDDVRPYSFFADFPGPQRPLVAGLDAPVALAGSWAVGADGTTQAADFAIEVGPGLAYGVGAPQPVNGADVRLAYDPETAGLVAQTIDLDLGVVRARGTARFDGAIAAMLDEGYSATPLPFDVTLETITADVRPHFAGPVSLERVSAAGTADLAARVLVFDRLEADGAGLSARLSGEVRLETLADGTLFPGLRLRGPVSGSATVEDVLGFWPIKLADGARVWLERSVPRGRISRIDFAVDMTAQDMFDKQLDAGELRLDFAFSGAEVRFVETMSPLTSARGRAQLLGNTFDLDLEGADIAGVTVTSGYVKIPRLVPKGATAVFGGVGEGELADVLAIVDEPPLRYISGNGRRPDEFSGTGAVTLAFSRPMLEVVPAEDFGFEITGAFRDISAPALVEGFPVTKAQATFAANPERLVVQGRGLVGPAEADFTWQERFDAPPEARTRLELTAQVDASVLDTFGVPSRTVFDGSAALGVSALGAGSEITHADFTLDLADATITLPGVSWSKASGQPASAAFSLRRGDADTIDVSDVSFASQGLAFEGAAAFSGDGRLEWADLTRLDWGPIADLSAQVRRSGQGLALRLSGAAVDARGAVAQIAAGGQGLGLGAPVRVTARFDRALVSDGVTLRDMAFDIDHDGSHVRSLSFSARDTTGRIVAEIAPDPNAEDDARILTATAPDAGLLLGVLFGMQQISGGELALEGRLPSAKRADEDPAELVFSVRDFTVARAPTLAQILTLGSLRGLADTLAGEGIAFSLLEAPVRLVDGRYVIGEARVSGPSLGLTVSGEVDFASEALGLEGVIVPAFAVNSMLGNVPILGDILVGRDGEGIFGFTYSVTGQFEETRVFVNPLSALAPGMLRRIFEPLGPMEAGPSREFDASGQAERPIVQVAPEN